MAWDSVVFLGGSGSITDITDCPNRRLLDEYLFFEQGTMLVGDDPGADAAIGEYLNKRRFFDVIIYTSEERAVNNAGGWEEKRIILDPTLEGIEFDRQKDLQMALDCDEALFAWDGKSEGTRQNILNVMALGKPVQNLMWEREDDTWYYLDGEIDASFLFGPNAYGRPLRLWLDDLREAPEGYHGCRSVLEAELCIRAAEEHGIPIEVIDCDHDLGIYAALGGDGIKLLDWLAERETFYPIALHTMNPVGRDNMQRMIERYWK